MIWKLIAFGFKGMIQTLTRKNHLEAGGSIASKTWDIILGPRLKKPLISQGVVMEEIVTEIPFPPVYKEWNSGLNFD